MARPIGRSSSRIRAHERTWTMNPLKKNLCKSAFVFLALFSLTGCRMTPENSGSALNELCPQDHILNLYVKTTDANTDAGTYSAGLAYYVNSDNNMAAVA